MASKGWIRYQTIERHCRGKTTLFTQTAIQFPLYRFREKLQQLRESPFTGESDFVATISKKVDSFIGRASDFVRGA
jgi:hypothetical protein